MKALTNEEKNSGVLTYLSLVNGKFSIKCEPETPGVVEVVNKEGVKRYYKQFNKIDNVLLIGLFINDGSFGKRLQIQLYNDEFKERYCIDVNISSGYAYTFINKLPGLEINEPFTIKSFKIKNENGYFNEILQLIQNGEPLKNGFPENTVPKLEKIPVKNGKFIYSDFNRIAFYENFIESEIKPKTLNVFKQFIKQ